MIEIIHTGEGEIKAVCEYYIVDEGGNFAKDGIYVWINEVFVAPKFRSNGCLKSLVKNVLDKVPKECQFGYFWRQDKYPNRKIRMWHRKEWEKIITDGQNVTI